MKITEFPTINSPKVSDVFLLDGSSGTKSILFPDLVNSIKSLGILSTFIHESGTWTPILTREPTSTITEASASNCSYTKLGEWVILRATLNVGGNKIYSVRGLPFTKDVGLSPVMGMIMCENDREFPYHSTAPYEDKANIVFNTSNTYGNITQFIAIYKTS